MPGDWATLERIQAIATGYKADTPRRASGARPFRFGTCRVRQVELVPADAWIAATALLLNVPLITHNAAHYVGIDGLRVISEA